MQTCVGPELPLTYWRLPDGASHWTPKLPIVAVFGRRRLADLDRLSSGLASPGAMAKLAFSWGGLSTLAKNVKVSGAGVAVAAFESVKVHVPSPLLATCVTSVPTGMSVPLTPSPMRSL